MNIFKAQAVKDPDRVARAIPVIDVGPAFRSEPGGLEAAAAEVRDASEHVGFFYLAGHGVDPAVVADAFTASREFHAMPLTPVAVRRFCNCPRDVGRANDMADAGMM